jgi:transposase InsO family protein
MRKKALSPASRRAYALEAVEEGLGSGRKVCRILEVPRSSYWYRPREKTPWEQSLLKRLMELSDKHPRYGYRRITALLRQEGWPVGKRHIQSLRRSLGLRVPPTKRKVIRRGHSTGLPVKAEYKGHVWTWDFICDGTTRGGALRMLTILDEYTRECHVLRADRALKSGDVLEWMSRAIQQHGSPAFLRSDNGSEFIAKTVQKWLAENRIKTIYIEPGSPWQNGLWRASTDDSGTNASTGNSSGRSPKPAWSSKTTAGNTTASGLTANWAISARNASRLGRAHHPRLRSAYGLPTPEMDNPTTTH